MVEMHAFMTLEDVSSITREVLTRHMREGAYLATKLVAELKAHQKNNKLSVGEDRDFSFAIMEISLRLASLLTQLSKLPFPESNDDRAFECNITNRQVFFLVAENPHFVSNLKTGTDFDMRKFLNNQATR